MNKMITRRSFLSALGCAAVAGGMTACGANAASQSTVASSAAGADAAQTNAPIVVNIARGGDTVTMDPIYAGDNVDIWLMNLVFEGLVRSTADGKNTADILRAYGLDIDLCHTAVTQEIVDEVHAIGQKVNCWTVNAPEDGARLAAMGVDYITSNILEGA